ncbi:MAG: HIT domain-containing protein [Chloroflexi bacterium]|nr:HIT domain-containing protein [Chloroflexota bacterium]
MWTPWRMPYLLGHDRRNDGQCVFCVKSAGDPDDDAFNAQEYIVARAAHVFVALNLYPYSNGHVLIVPYAHVPSVEDLAPDVLTDLMLTLNRVLAALRAVYQPQGFNVGFNLGTGAGAGIPDHVHMHVVPRWGGDTGFMTVTGGARTIPDLLDDTYRKLRAAWAAV